MSKKVRLYILLFIVLIIRALLLNIFKQAHFNHFDVTAKIIIQQGTEENSKPRRSLIIRDLRFKEVVPSAPDHKEIQLAVSASPKLIPEKLNIHLPFSFWSA